MEQQHQYEQLTKFVVGQKLIAEQPFSLVDAGCSGGIASFWRIFEPSFKALGIDPLLTEVKRLQGLERNPSVKYMAAFIGLPSDHPLPVARGDKPATERSPWQRLSSHAASEILKTTVPRADALAVLNAWREDDEKAVRRLGIDELISEQSLPSVDFIKIDIDSLDLDALVSSEQTIRNSPVLGLALEVNFYGSSSPTEHTFHNTDRLMRSWGFDLFDLSVRRYSSAALPQPFQWDIPAQTHRGRPFQGDAIYLRDPCAPGFKEATGLTLTGEKILKLACLFELFGLPDHAAELLIATKETINQIVPVEKLLNILAKEVCPSTASYDEYIRLFQADPTFLYPSNQSKTIKRSWFKTYQ
jgi:hypothetical protein